MSGTPLGPHLLHPESLEQVAEGDLITLAASTVRHLRKVLRASDGAPLSVTDGEGRLAHAHLVGDRAHIDRVVPLDVRPRPVLVLVQALSKGRRAEDAVRAAAELGVDRIVPLITERLQGRPDAAARAAVVARWQSVADAALEQSRGVHRTQVDPVVGIDALDPAALLAPDACRGLVTVPGAPDLATVLATGDPRGGRVGGVAVAVGPEGGWTDGERAALVGLGWEPAGLGRTVLRTEHAGPVALAVVAALTGRWADEG